MPDLEFDWPWMFGALLLPLLVMLLVPRAAASTLAIRIPVATDMSALTDWVSTSRRGWRTFMAAFVFVLLTLAAARPVAVGDAVDAPVSGRDIMIAVDISASMAEMDWRSEATRVTRMSVVQRILGDFIQGRRGDRIGIVVFGSRAYLQTPLTFDVGAAQKMLRDTIVGLAGPATAMGDAVGLTIKRLIEADAKHRVVILVSDGAANAGWTKPEDAARVALAEGVTIYTIGVGTKRREGDSSGPKTGLDEPTLQMLATGTGGRYFLARGGDELEQISAELDRLEPAVLDSRELYRRTDLYPWPLGVALGLTFLLVLVGWRRNGGVA